jgi:hypothetical protein
MATIYQKGESESVKGRTDKAMATRYQRRNKNPLIEGQTK